MTDSTDKQTQDPAWELVRHALATVAYRGGKVLREFPAELGGFQAGHDVRTPVQIVAHIGDLFDWARSTVLGQSAWKSSQPLPWEQEVDRFYASIAALDRAIAAGVPAKVSVARMLQGPIADSLTHVGQLAILRRMAGVPIRGENFVSAKIEVGRVGPDQAPPAQEFG